MANDLLAYHAYAVSYTPTHLLIAALLGVYQRQVSTTSGAMTQHAFLAHQKQMTWAAVVTYYMQAHDQWLAMASRQVMRLCGGTFQRASRSTGSTHSEAMCACVRELYDSASVKKKGLWAHYATQCSAQHLTRHVAHIGRLPPPTSLHLLGMTRSICWQRWRSCVSCSSSVAAPPPLIKRDHKRLRPTVLDTCAVQLTGSLDC